VPGAAAVEAEDELVETGLEMLAAQAVVDTQDPDLEVGEDPVHPGQYDVGRHLADDMGIVADAGSAGIGGPSVGLGGGPRCEVGGDEGMQAAGRAVGHFAQTDAAGSSPAILDLDSADDQHPALMAAATTTGERIVLAAADDLGLVDFDEAGERVAAGCDHAAAQLAAEQPGTAVRSQAELALQLQSRDPVGMGGHQIGRPEPGGQRQLGMVHDGPGGHRGLLAAAGAFPGPRFGLQFPRLGHAAAGADKPLGPAHREEVFDAGCLIGKAMLKLDQRTGKIGHGGSPRAAHVRYLFYHATAHTATTDCVTGRRGISRLTYILTVTLQHLSKKTST
jgi:hypothetical protein